MRVFVTGASGILGRHAVRHLSSLRPDATIISNRADLTNIEATKTMVSSCQAIDIVIHLAALVPLTSVKADPARAYAVNVGGTINLLSALRETNASFTYCSSSHIYASSGTPISEEAEKGPVSLYGRTKWAAEQAAADICVATGRNFLAARVFSIHDSEQTGSYLRPSIMRRLAQEDLSQPFELQGGNSIRDFLKAERAAELIVKLALNGITGPVNVASGRGTRVSDFVQSFSSQPLDIIATGSADTLVADISRLKMLLGEFDG